MKSIPRDVCLFDIDGTLSHHKAPVCPKVVKMIQELSEVMDVGVVSGARHEEVNRLLQLCLPKIRYIFAENGGIAYDRNKCLLRDSITRAVPSEKLEKLTDCLTTSIQMHEGEIEDVRKALVASGNLMDNGPVKITRETAESWIDRRSGLWNVSLLGRVPSPSYREFLATHFIENKIREKIVAAMLNAYGPKCPWRIACGGAVSIDIYPLGWDKTRCLEFLPEEAYIFFFGDKTDAGGNDYEIYNHGRTEAYKVESVKDTIKKVYRKVLGRPSRRRKLGRGRQMSSPAPTSASSKRSK